MGLTSKQHCKFYFITRNALPFLPYVFPVNVQEERRLRVPTLRYRKISDISRTNLQNINVSDLVLQLSLPNPFKPGVKWITKM